MATTTTITSLKKQILGYNYTPKGIQTLIDPNLWSDFNSSLQTQLSYDLRIDAKDWFNMLAALFEFVFIHPDSIAVDIFPHILTSCQTLLSLRYRSCFCPQIVQLEKIIVRLYELLINFFPSLHIYHSLIWPVIQLLHVLLVSYTSQFSAQIRSQDGSVTVTALKSNAELILTKLLPSHSQFMALMISYLQYHIVCHNKSPLSHVSNTSNHGQSQQQQQQQRADIDSTSHSNVFTLSSLYYSMPHSLDETTDSLKSSTKTPYERTYALLTRPHLLQAGLTGFSLSYIESLVDIASTIRQTAPSSANLHTIQSSEDSSHTFIAALASLHTSFQELHQLGVFSYPNMGLLVNDLHSFYQRVVLKEDSVIDTVNNNDTTDQSSEDVTITSLTQIDPSKYLRAMPKIQLAVRGMSKIDTNGVFNNNNNENGNNTSISGNDAQIHHSLVNNWLGQNHSHMLGIFSSPFTNCLSPLLSTYSSLHTHLNLYYAMYSQFYPTLESSVQNIASFPTEIISTASRIELNLNAPVASSSKKPTVGTSSPLPLPAAISPAEFHMTFFPLWMDMLLISLKQYFSLELQNDGLQTHAMAQLRAKKNIVVSSNASAAATIALATSIESSAAKSSTSLFDIQPNMNTSSTTATPRPELAQSRSKQELSRILQNEQYAIESTLVLLAVGMYTATPHVPHSVSSSSTTFLSSTLSPEHITPVYNALVTTPQSVASSQFSGLAFSFAFVFSGHQLYNQSRDRSLSLFTLLQSVITSMSYLGSVRPTAQSKNCTNSTSTTSQTTIITTLQTVLAAVAVDNYGPSVLNQFESKAEAFRAYFHSLSASSPALSHPPTHTSLVRTTSRRFSPHDFIENLICDINSRSSAKTNSQIFNQSQLTTNLKESDLNLLCQILHTIMPSITPPSTTSSHIANHAQSSNPFFPLFSTLAHMINNALTPHHTSDTIYLGLNIQEETNVPAANKKSSSKQKNTNHSSSSATLQLVTVPNPFSDSIETQQKHLAWVISAASSSFMHISTSLLTLASDVVNNTLPLCLAFSFVLSHLSSRTLERVTALSTPHLATSNASVALYHLILDQKHRFCDYVLQSYIDFRQTEILVKCFFRTTIILAYPQLIISPAIYSTLQQTSSTSTSAYFPDISLLPSITAPILNIPSDSIPKFSLAASVDILNSCANSLQLLTTSQLENLRLVWNQLISFTQTQQQQHLVDTHPTTMTWESTFRQHMHPTQDDATCESFLSSCQKEPNMIDFASLSSSQRHTIIQQLVPHIDAAQTKDNFSSANSTNNVAQTISGILLQFSSYLDINHVNSSAYQSIIETQSLSVYKCTVIQNVQLFIYNAMRSLQQQQQVAASQSDKKSDKKARKQITDSLISSGSQSTSYSLPLLRDFDQFILHLAFPHVHNPCKNFIFYCSKTPTHLSLQLNELLSLPLSSLISLSQALSVFRRRLIETTSVPSHFLSGNAMIPLIFSFAATGDNFDICLSQLLIHTTESLITTASTDYNAKDYFIQLMLAMLNTTSQRFSTSGPLFASPLCHINPEMDNSSNGELSNSLSFLVSNQSAQHTSDDNSTAPLAQLVIAFLQSFQHIFHAWVATSSSSLSSETSPYADIIIYMLQSCDFLSHIPPSISISMPKSQYSSFWSFLYDIIADIIIAGTSQMQSLLFSGLIVRSTWISMHLTALFGHIMTRIFSMYATISTPSYSPVMHDATTTIQQSSSSSHKDKEVKKASKRSKKSEIETSSPNDVSMVQLDICQSRDQLTTLLHTQFSSSQLASVHSFHSYFTACCALVSKLTNTTSSSRDTSSLLLLNVSSTENQLLEQHSFSNPIVPTSLAVPIVNITSFLESLPIELFSSSSSSSSPSSSSTPFVELMFYAGRLLSSTLRLVVPHSNYHRPNTIITNIILQHDLRPHVLGATTAVAAAAQTTMLSTVASCIDSLLENIIVLHSSSVSSSRRHNVHTASYSSQMVTNIINDIFESLGDAFTTFLFHNASSVALYVAFNVISEHFPQITEDNAQIGDVAIESLPQLIAAEFTQLDTSILPPHDNDRPIALLLAVQLFLVIFVSQQNTSSTLSLLATLTHHHVKASIPDDIISSEYLLQSVQKVSLAATTTPETTKKSKKASKPCVPQVTPNASSLPSTSPSIPPMIVQSYQHIVSNVFLHRSLASLHELETSVERCYERYIAATSQHNDVTIITSDDLTILSEYITSISTISASLACAARLFSTQTNTLTIPQINILVQSGRIADAIATINQPLFWKIYPLLLSQIHLLSQQQSSLSKPTSRLSTLTNSLFTSTDLSSQSNDDCYALSIQDDSALQMITTLLQVHCRSQLMLTLTSFTSSPNTPLIDCYTSSLETIQQVTQAKSNGSQNNNRATFSSQYVLDILPPIVRYALFTLFLSSSISSMFSSTVQSQQHYLVDLYRDLEHLSSFAINHALSVPQFISVFVPQENHSSSSPRHPSTTATSIPIAIADNATIAQLLFTVSLQICAPAINAAQNPQICLFDVLCPGFFPRIVASQIIPALQSSTIFDHISSHIIMYMASFIHKTVTTVVFGKTKQTHNFSSSFTVIIPFTPNIHTIHGSSDIRSFGLSVLQKVVPSQLRKTKITALVGTTFPSILSFSITASDFLAHHLDQFAAPGFFGDDDLSTATENLPTISKSSYQSKHVITSHHSQQQDHLLAILRISSLIIMGKQSYNFQKSSSTSQYHSITPSSLVAVDNQSVQFESQTNLNDLTALFPYPHPTAISVALLVPLLLDTVHMYLKQSQVVSHRDMTSILAILSPFSHLFSRVISHIPTLSTNASLSTSPSSLPYHALPDTILLNVLLFTFDAFCSVLCEIPTHITSLRANEDDNDISAKRNNCLSLTNQHLLLSFLTMGLHPLLSFSFISGRHLLSSVQLYSDQLHHHYTNQNYIVQQFDAIFATQIAFIRSNAHRFSKILVRMSSTTAKRCIPYVILPICNTYMSLHSSHPSQSLQALLKPVFFSLSILLASVKPPQTEGNIYVSHFDNTLTDTDMVACDPRDLLPWHDLVAKTALEELLAMVTKYRYYR